MRRPKMTKKQRAFAAQQRALLKLRRAAVARSLGSLSEVGDILLRTALDEACDSYCETLTTRERVELIGDAGRVRSAAQYQADRIPRSSLRELLDARGNPPADLTPPSSTFAERLGTAVATRDGLQTASSSPDYPGRASALAPTRNTVAADAGPDEAWLETWKGETDVR